MANHLELIAATTWFWTFSTGFIASIIFTIATIFCPKFWWFPIISAIWIWYDRNTCERGGRPIQWVREWSWWRLMKSYFNYNLITDDSITLDPSKNYLFTCYPHGIFPIGPFSGFVNGYQRYFPKHKAYTTALGIQFSLPIIRELFLAIGAVSVSGPSLKYLLRSENGGGNIVNLLIGGGDEAKYSHPGQYKIILKKRKGFIKLALQNGISLVPVFSFGETDAFNQLEFPGFNFIRELVKKATQIALVIPIGTYLICPNPARITTVVGKPIDVEKIANPTNEEIDKLHEKFTNEITKLFDKYKGKYVKEPNKTFLEIV